jgi:transcriptional regulator with XRE-family HTH domain
MLKRLNPACFFDKRGVHIMPNSSSPCPYDLPHFGVMFRHIRETLGLKQSKIADHISADVATVNRFEKLGTTHAETVEDIIDALNSPKLSRGLIRHTLTQGNIDLLHLRPDS